MMFGSEFGEDGESMFVFMIYRRISYADDGMIVFTHKHLQNSELPRGMPFKKNH